MSTFLTKLRTALHIGTKAERRQHRTERNALDARVRAEYLSTFTRDVNGLGRIDPDRRHYPVVTASDCCLVDCHSRPADLWASGRLLSRMPTRCWPSAGRKTTDATEPS
jgi:hypothetical protein